MDGVSVGTGIGGRVQVGVGIGGRVQVGVAGGSGVLVAVTSGIGVGVGEGDIDVGDAMSVSITFGVCVAEEVGSDETMGTIVFDGVEVI